MLSQQSDPRSATYDPGTWPIISTKFWRQRSLYVFLFVYLTDSAGTLLLDSFPRLNEQSWKAHSGYASMFLNIMGSNTELLYAVSLISVFLKTS